MNDDVDATIIQGLFAVGLALALVALFVFLDGELTLAVVAVASLLVSVGIAAFAVIRIRRQPRER